MTTITLRINYYFSLAVIFGVLLQTVQASWWYLGVISTSQVSSPSTTSDKLGELKLSKEKSCMLQFLDPRQQELCKREEKIIKVISEGASMGIKECQHQFSTRRWNCSTFNTTNVFGQVLNIKSRETAFIYAVSSAGVMYSITRACAKGELEKCGCDVNVRSRPTDGQFEWGGCSENTKFGSKFSRDFVDANFVKKNSENELMNLWNNEAGRKVVVSEVDVICKCHGVSGSCSIKVCWRKMKPFREIGRELKNRFDGATRVKLSRRKRKLKRINKEMKRPTKKDLVYLQESPDFCNYNPRLGSLGTRGRRCNRTSYGLDGCTLMCCGRGHYTIVKEIQEDCNCKFVWCCRVDCKKCSHIAEMHFCN